MEILQRFFKLIENICVLKGVSLCKDENFINEKKIDHD